MRPIIGVTAGETINHQYPHAPMVQGQAHTYIDAIIRAGGTPVILPLTKNKHVLRQLYETCDGLLFSGGNDVNPALYGESDEYAVDFSVARDRQELQLLEWSLEDDRPILAICRGMQLLNIERGGTLYQDVPTDLPEAENHNIAAEKKRESRIVHKLRIKPDSQLAKTLDALELGANAYHHQAIKKLGDGVIATAWAEDGVIEGIELMGAEFVIGVQSHPESLESSIEPRWRKLFDRFVEAARQSSQAQQPAPS